MRDDAELLESFRQGRAESFPDAFEALSACISARFTDGFCALCVRRRRPRN